jgi:pyruvate dehydrogenase E2 component (dihydrolipoamide acetyltransferase)
MPIEIKMPALSPTMEKGNLSKWLVKEGDEVKAGDLIAEIETDKATMEVEAVDEGRVAKLVVAEGAADIPVGTVIAILLEEGEEKPSEKASPKPAAETKPAPAVKTAPPVAQAAPSAPEPIAQPALKSGSDERVSASPLAQRLAQQMGIDLHNIKGSGPGGRVIKRDLEIAAPAAPAAPVTPAPQPAKAAAPVMAPPADNPYEEIRLSPMRKIIAQRLSLSKQTIPHFYMTVDVEIDRLLSLRKEFNETQDVKLSVNDFLIRALGLALKKVPDANVQYAGDKMYRFARADVSVAVAIPGGLVTPIIRGAEAKGLAAISTEMKILAEKARAGKLMPEDYQGGTISLSNLGMYGIRQFDAVINPPQAAILAVGAGEERAVIRGGTVVAATIMTATLSCDHRAIDGAVGAELLSAFKNLLQNPLAMLL